MKKSILLTLMVSATMLSFGQNISVTFTGTGVATRIDSVTATNLTTNQSVTFPGNETLVLGANTGISAIAELSDPGMVFPNPFSGKATFVTTVQMPQIADLKIRNLVGQVIAQTQAFIQPGENEFSISVNRAGIYLITLTADLGTASCKVICTETTTADNRIQYLGPESNNNNNHNNHNNHNNNNNHNNFSSTGLKSSQTTNSLGYHEGEIILYRCMSSIYTTIVSDSPTSSKNYEVKFVACTDADGMNYSVVKIGGQTWMAQNLAYLPAVSPSASGSDTARHYWVYDYEGSSVIEAKANANYTTYGGLYNWEASKTVCPFGWHLPDDQEWKILETYQGMNPSDADSSNWRGSGSVGKKMKSTSLWGGNGNGDNSSGFTALPGGSRDIDGYFYGNGDWVGFWSSSATKAAVAWHRSLYYDGDGVVRSNIGRGYGFSVRCLKDSPVPIAGFTVTPSSGTIATNFQFDASGCKDDETPLSDLEVRWDWNGDSIWDTGYDKSKIIFHQYSSPGSRIVICEVRDGDGFVGTEAKNVYVAEGTVTDSRDGRVYAYKTIGTQTWMLENLAWLPKVCLSIEGSLTSPFYYVYDYDGNSTGEAKTQPTFLTYGVLYNWEAALTACPPGWHLPNDEEWKTLEKYFLMSAPEADATGMRNSGTVGGKLKEAGHAHWSSPNMAATNEGGFTALPGGLRYGAGGFDDLGDRASFWTASGSGDSYAFLRNLFQINAGVERNAYPRRVGFSIRCLKGGSKPAAGFTIDPQSGTLSTQFLFDASVSTDHETPTNELEVRWDWTGDGTWDTGYSETKTVSHQYSQLGSYSVILEVKDGDGLVDTETKTVIVAEGTLTDSRDGRAYAYKTIGTQTWMIENLAYLPSVSPSSAGSDTAPFYYVFGYAGGSVDDAKATSNYAAYGVLYNWPAAMAACPGGWHLPTETDWTTLTNYLGGESVAGGKMKEAGTVNWANPNTGATNSSGFTALPDGYRSGVDAIFVGLGQYAIFWSSTVSTLNGVDYRYISYDNTALLVSPTYRKTGVSVRCLRN